MIQPLRTIHRRVFFGLAVALPAVLFAAVVARPKQAFMAAGLTSVRAIPNGEAIHWKRHSVISTIQRATTGQASTIHFAFSNNFEEPDVLVYWSPVEPRAESLPSDAIFLGTLHQQNIQAEFKASEGFLVLYSLPHASVIDAAALGGQP